MSYEYTYSIIFSKDPFTLILIQYKYKYKYEYFINFYNLQMKKAKTFINILSRMNINVYVKIIVYMQKLTEITMT